MVAIAATKLSSKGQIVIPEAIRDDMGLKPGMRFIVVRIGDDVLLRTLREPDLSELPALLAESNAAARRAGVKRSDLAKAIKQVRASSKRRARKG